jgi:putative hemolysin
MARELVVIVFLMLLNGLFAGAEIAVLSVRKTRLAELIEQGLRGARAVSWLRQEPERFLATVQVGITVVGTTAAAFGGEALAGDFAAMLADVPYVGAHAKGVGLGVVVVGISFLEIVVGELVPKSLALRSAERYALLLGPLLRGMATAMKPVVWVLTKSSNLVLRFFGDRTSFAEARLSPEEIQELVEEAARVGSLDGKSSEIASRALDLRDLTARDLLVPRSRIVSLPVDASAEAVRERLRERKFNRMPVYAGSEDNVVGYVALKDLVSPLLAGEPLLLDSFKRPARFVPETMPALDLLRVMQAEPSPLAIVVDESGGVTGLVTMEDLLEELVGEVVSEQDGPVAAIILGPDGWVDLPGETPVREVNRALQLELPEEEGANTLAGLVIHASERIPEVGTRVALADGTKLDVLDASPRRVKRVRLRPPAAPGPHDSRG